MDMLLTFSSPLPFSRALLTSAVRSVTSGMKVQNDSCLKLAFISLFPNISHQIASQWNNDNLNIDDLGIQGHVSSACKLQLSRWTHKSIIPIQCFNQM